MLGCSYSAWAKALVGLPCHLSAGFTELNPAPRVFRSPGGGGWWCGVVLGVGVVVVGTHSMKVTIYAPPFRPPFFRSLATLYRFDPYILAKMRKMYFDPYILAKMRKMSYFDPYFSSKLGKMYSFDPLFYPCSVSSRRAVRSIPIRNLTEHPSPHPHPTYPPTPRAFAIELLTLILQRHSHICTKEVVLDPYICYTEAVAFLFQ